MPTNGFPEPVPGPIDPVADLLVRSILDSLPDSARPGGSGIRIGLDGLRNQSHTGPEEYRRFIRRLAGGLSDAAAGTGVTFEASSAVEPEYRFDGAAYLATRGGFDVWELYLRLSSTSRRGIIWRLDEPVTVLRQPRPNQPQFLAYPSSSSR